LGERNSKGSVAAPGIVTKAVLTWVLDMLERGQSVAMASVIEASGSVPGKPGARMAITEKGAKFGTVGGAGLEMKVENALQGMLNGGREEVRKKGGRVETFALYKDAKGKEVTPLDSLCGGRVTVAMEVMDPMPHILIAGGGHVGRAVAIVCDTLGWSHSVFDVRAEFAEADRYPFASELHSVRCLSSSGARTQNQWSDSRISSYSGMIGRLTKRCYSAYWIVSSPARDLGLAP